MKINVIDLDNTLIPYDSFRKYVFFLIRITRKKYYYVLYSVLRKIRLLSIEKFKYKIVLEARTTPEYRNKMMFFAENLHKDLNPDILEIILNYSNSETINIICSASVDDYVQYLAKILGWEYVCSSADDTHFTHIYGEKKIEAIEAKYPSNSFEYNFAISDSPTDLSLLKKFRHFKLLSNS